MALAALAVLVVEPPPRDHHHYWVYWTISMVVYALVATACTFAFIVLLRYQLHTTPCQSMGTC